MEKLVKTVTVFFQYSRNYSEPQKLIFVSEPETYLFVFRRSWVTTVRFLNSILQGCLLLRLSISETRFIFDAAFLFETLKYFIKHKKKIGWVVEDLGIFA